MRTHSYITVLAVLASLAIAGCAQHARVTYIPEGGSYTADELSAALDDSDPGSASRVMIEDALTARQEALADLRTHGDDAALLADVLTAEFPTDTAAIPYAVEVGAFNDEPAWIVYEAWGDAGEPLTHRRVWVFSRDDLSVVAADSVR
ncbi:MAG: hypothetical protein WBJ62_10440 [Coriobacteriia bacterium]|jgi:hypothetical protein